MIGQTGENTNVHKVSPPHFEPSAASYYRPTKRFGYLVNFQTGPRLMLHPALQPLLVAFYYMLEAYLCRTGYIQWSWNSLHGWKRELVIKTQKFRKGVEQPKVSWGRLW